MSTEEDVDLDLDSFRKYSLQPKNSWFYYQSNLWMEDVGGSKMTDCSYGEPDCTGDEDNDYDMMCDEHRREYGENIADMRNDLD
jgi:hypothetical protein